jgi:hypothetical protein
VKKAIDKVDPDLRACVKKSPYLLLELAITVHGPKLDATKPAPKVKTKGKEKVKVPLPRPGTRRPVIRYGGAQVPAPAAGARVLVVARPIAGDPDEETVRTAVSCVEKVGAALALPAPSTPGTWATVTVPVIFR